MWLGRWWMVPIIVLLLGAAAALGVLRSLHPAMPARPMVEPETEVMPALTPRAILLGALVLLGLGITAAVLLLVNFSGTEPRDRLDAIRTAATLLVGTGGAAALLLAARRQRAAELSLAVQRKAAADTAHDAAARRITELYLKAVEQLGSDKAAVRHGGLYALERVAQDNPHQRQTVINVICAYLRSPYAPPPEQAATRRTGLSMTPRRRIATDRVTTGSATARRISLRPPTPAVTSEQLRQEREVRLTAQRILTTHLCFGLDTTSGQPTDSLYWGEAYDLDLTGATLIDFNAAGLTLRQAAFTEVHFSGGVWFGDAEFSGIASFNGAIFSDVAGFTGTTFNGGAQFNRATFSGNALFSEVTFSMDATFDGANFNGGASFDKVTFSELAWFRGATFVNGAEFDHATFSRIAWFSEATFIRGVNCHKANFNGDAWFTGTTFIGVARFDGVTFNCRAVFEYSTFGIATFDGVNFFRGARFMKTRFAVITSMKKAVAAEVSIECTWPEGWTVNDQHRGTAAPGEASDTLLLVPVPVVLTKTPEPSGEFQGVQFCS
ncbi:pentapeptide repeat-containing protein [Lentzea sp. NPDC003310]|uniref:pentapeptide repeat-containing protein n=1 Tax=Lentzea sp. NPDC003310 TaxID=3154447 RepID=UPI0033B24551